MIASHRKTADGKILGAAPRVIEAPSRPTIFVVDDEQIVRTVIRAAFEDAGWDVVEFAGCEAFLSGYQPTSNACLVLDTHMPGMSGLDLVAHLRSDAIDLPIVMISGSSDIATAVTAMKGGVDDFFEKPLPWEALRVSVARALLHAKVRLEAEADGRLAASRIDQLTARQREVMALVLTGSPSKIIAHDLGVSQRTVETHRAAIMRKMRANSIPTLARLVLEASRV